MTRGKDRILEEYLVASARLGVRSAAEQLVALRGPRLLAHAIRLMGDRDDAQDVVQEAWIEILRGLSGIRDDRAFPAWATRIVTRRAARMIAKKVKHRTLNRDLSAETQDWVEEDGPLSADARAVRDAIRELPPEQAATIGLFYLEDMRVAEVALAMDVPVGTVKTRLLHARHKLATLLKGDDDEQA